MARDQPGLLAATAGALAHLGCDVVDVVLATWDDGAALESFRIDASDPLNTEELIARVADDLSVPQRADPLPDATVTFIDAAWHTVCEVRAPDRPGVLHALAVAFASHRVEVLALTAARDGGEVIDRFDRTDRRGAKLGIEEQAQVRTAILEGVEQRRRWLVGRRARYG